MEYINICDYCEKHFICHFVEVEEDPFVIFCNYCILFHPDWDLEE